MQELTVLWMDEEINAPIVGVVSKEDWDFLNSKEGKGTVKHHDNFIDFAPEFEHYCYAENFPVSVDDLRIYHGDIDNAYDLWLEAFAIWESSKENDAPL